MQNYFKDSDEILATCQFTPYCEVFFWDFERSINTTYNCRILELLVESTIASSEKEKKLFYKPIILLIASIIESIFYDFLVRIRMHSREKIKNLSDQTINEIKNMKKLPSFLQNFNDIYKKHQNILNNQKIYNLVDELIEARNRIHIPNRTNYTPKREIDLWNDITVKKFGNLLADIFIILGSQYPRNEKGPKPDFDQFPRPWENL